MVLTIPKRLRLHVRFDRKLRCVREEIRGQLGRQHALPGMVVAIQTHGELLHWHPHIHALVTCGAFTAAGEWLAVPELDKERLRWRGGKRSSPSIWPRERSTRRRSRTCAAGRIAASAPDQSVLLAAGDRAGVQRVAQYITRCPFSLARLVKVTPTGQVIYRAEKAACHPFPDPRHPGLAKGTKRNFQLLPGVGLSRRVHATHSAARRDPGALLRLVLEQVAGHAAEGGGRRGGPCRRCPRSPAAATQRPDLGDADQAGVRGGSAHVPGVRRADEVDLVHRAAARGGDRADPAALRPVAGGAAASVAWSAGGVGGRIGRWWRTEVRRRGDVLGDVLSSRQPRAAWAVRAHAGPLSGHCCVKIGPDGSLPGRSARQQGRGKRRVAAATLLFPRPCPLEQVAPSG